MIVYSPRRKYSQLLSCHVVQKVSSAYHNNAIRNLANTKHVDPSKTALLTQG